MKNKKKYIYIRTHQRICPYLMLLMHHQVSDRSAPPNHHHNHQSPYIVSFLPSSPHTETTRLILPSSPRHHTLTLHPNMITSPLSPPPIPHSHPSSLSFIPSHPPFFLFLSFHLFLVCIRHLYIPTVIFFIFLSVWTSRPQVNPLSRFTSITGRVMTENWVILHHALPFSIHRKGKPACLPAWTAPPLPDARTR